ncbi:MAG: hypothetical protein DI564_15455 [Rhodanobacter denitrificans]|uniref:MxaA protein n=1 Tax=Rhodanobacter denitrificans TaxID=666685 RepID=A0A2W5K6M3_9GAMM|nr:MAG: hypothetical protein DI564_15455 [Rhodanobacter denitrificans]
MSTMRALLSPLGRSGMAVALGLLTAAGACADDGPIRAVQPLDTRAVGYTLGDRVPRSVVLRVDRDWQLQTTALPAPGPQTYWLELRALDVHERLEGDARIYRIDLDYQTFYAPIQALERSLPAFEVTVRRGEQTAHARVPPFRFTMSPLREVKLSAGGEERAPTALRPDIEPGSRPLRPALAALAAAVAAAAAFALALAWHYARWPFGRRPARPFAQAARRLRRVLPDYRQALLTVHRAFDATAGRRVLAEDAAALIDAQPRYAPLAADIGRFFAASRQAFFGSGEQDAAALLPAAELTALTRRLAAAERRPA